MDKTIIECPGEKSTGQTRTNNNDEKAILTKTVNFLKTTLAEHGV